jgi:SdrD B-like domain
VPTLHTSSRARRPNRVRLGIESLEARDVPATIDLTVAGGSGSANDALFQQSAALANPADFLTFVRLDAAGVEQGYNSDGRPVQFNESSRPLLNHSLQLGDIPTVTVSGVTYREFVLSINEPSRRSLLSLDELRIYVASTGNLLGYSAATKQLSGIPAVYDLDAGGDNTVLLNNNLNGATGPGDAKVLIPDSVFAGAAPTDFVYLYSKFGVNLRANGAFEAWGVQPVVAPPPPTGNSLSGFVYLDANTNGERDLGEAGIEGVIIQLWFLNTTTMLYEPDPAGTTAATLADGSYVFTGLQLGTTYALAEETPVGNFTDGFESVGSLGGTADNDFIFGIEFTLANGQQGTDYNFGEFSGGGG